MRPKPIHISEIMGRVHAAIITIRHDEYDAVESRLEDPISVDGGNNNYEVATLQPDHGGPISVALTRCVHQGNLSAQAVANNIIQDLDPAWLLLVGIAGGVPDNDFSLGDVILASALHDFSFGAAAQDGRRTYQIGGGPMHAEVERFLQTKIGGRNRDRLIDLAGFRTRDEFLNHPAVFLPGKDLPASLYGEPDFQAKSFDTISRRFAGGTRSGGVRVWSGPCANGDLLVKDTALLATWQQSARQIVEVETELAGVYEAARKAGRQNYPVFAIRGLSDIVGLKRNPDWTQYACDSAAAFACAILRSGFIEFSKNLPNAQIGSPQTGGVTPVSRSYTAPKIAAGILQSDLFATLRDLLKATSPPSAECLRDQWQHYLRAHWPPLAAEALPELLTPPTPQIEALLTAYEWALAAHDETLPPAKSPASTYVEACAASLRGAGSDTVVPFALIDESGSSVVLEFVFETHLSEGCGLFCHPSSSSCEVMLGQHFVQGLLRAWSLSAPLFGESDRTVFWSVRRADGSSGLPSFVDGDDASANGAAFLAFWHVRRGLRPDQDVYIVAECQVDGSVRPVSGLSAKITAIKQHRDSLKQEAPATIVIAATITNRTRQDDIAIARASTWADVKIVATTAELSAVRSCTAVAVIAYMEHLAQTLDETPWTRDGKIVHLSDVHVAPQVWKDEYSFYPAVEDERGGSESDWRPAGYDPAGADREVAPRVKQQRQKIRVPWITEFQRPQQQQHPMVVIGGPGFGKTSLLRWTAREMVLESLAALNARTKTPSEVRWPIITDLAAWLGQTGRPRESLQESALAFAPLPEGCPVLRQQALAHVMKSRLLDHEEYTHLFLDALDQVPVAQLQLLRERLRELGSVAPRIVFSTREAALTTHLPLLSIPRLTILEAAALSTEDARALAAKWLDSKLATRLEAHLRAQPALSVVADSPLLLTLACGIVARSPKAELPETAAYLYRALMQSLARGEWRDVRTNAADKDPDALLARLHPMAWRLFSREAGINLFRRDTLIRALNADSGPGNAQADAALNELSHLGFLEGSGHSQDEPQYQFRHTTFLEFLAAAHLAAEINAEGWIQARVSHWHRDNGWQPIKVSEMLDTSAFERSWEPLFTFTIGLLVQPRPLLEMLADRGKDDHYRHRLRLFYLCCGALATSKEDGLESVLETGLRELRILGLKTVRRMPEMREQWLANVKVIANLPKTGRQLTGILVTVARYHSETHFGGAERIPEALSRPASKKGAENCLTAILALCIEPDAHIHGYEAADKLVTIATQYGLPEFLRQMLAVIEDARDRPWLQITLARSLLRCEEIDVADRAVDVLVAIAENQQLDRASSGVAT